MADDKTKCDKQNDNNYHGKHLQHCENYILTALKEANTDLTYEQLGKKYRYGYLRNVMGRLVEQGKVAPVPKEWPKRFILPRWGNRPEYASVQRYDKRGTVGRFDFLSYLGSLNWSSPLSVHNLRFSFLVYQFSWVKEGWNYDRSSKSWCKVLELSYPVRVQCYDTGSVLVSVKCSARPFPLDLNGLLAISNLLVEVRCALHADCVPGPMEWIVVHWHLNRDSEQLIGDGLDVHLTFRDFFGDAAQFYNKRQLDVMRAEVSQEPKLSLQAVFEKIINRDNLIKGGLSNA